MKIMKYFLSLALFVSACSPVLAVRLSQETVALWGQMSEEEKEYVKQTNTNVAAAGSWSGLGLFGLGLSAYFYLKNQSLASIEGLIIAACISANNGYSAYKDINGATGEKAKQYLQDEFKTRFLSVVEGVVVGGTPLCLGALLRSINATLKK